MIAGLGGVMKELNLKKNHHHHLIFVPSIVFHLKQPLFNYKIPGNFSLPGLSKARMLRYSAKLHLQLQTPLLQNGWVINSRRNFAPHMAIAKRRSW